MDIFSSCRQRRNSTVSFERFYEVQPLSTLVSSFLVQVYLILFLRCGRFPNFLDFVALTLKVISKKAQV